ncbi:MAG TPA: hypothetical protein VGE36_13520 [Roseateles sp.]
MFVTRSTYNAALAEARTALEVAQVWKRRHNELLKEWNALVTKLNAKGGEAFLTGQASAPELGADDIKRLLQLCHPDRHDGKPMAVEMTRKLLALKRADSPSPGAAHHAHPRSQTSEAATKGWRPSHHQEARRADPRAGHGDWLWRGPQHAHRPRRAGWTPGVLVGQSHGC